MDELCGTHVQFRISETPCFMPKELLQEMAGIGRDLIAQLVTPQYRARSDIAIPPEFNVPNEPDHPLFVQVDFGLVRGADGELRPKLVELQAFPSLYAYQATLAERFIEIYKLHDAEVRQDGPAEPLEFLLSGLNAPSYRELLSRAIVGEHDPANVILMEIHPNEQKTLPDFLLTEKLWGVPTVDILDIKKQGSRLFYESSGKLIPIRRIYNRAIVDELQRKNLKPPFDWRDDLDLEWAGHPNWYFRMSKFSIPFLKHRSVPKTWFLGQMDKLPPDLENYALKPLYSFAGRGVVIGPKEEEIAAIRQADRANYILQERLHFEPIIDTPRGKTRVELRLMYVWLDELTPVLTIVRMGRGLMMGVDQNKNMEWVGSSAALFPRN